MKLWRIISLNLIASHVRIVCLSKFIGPNPISSLIDEYTLVCPFLSVAFKQSLGPWIVTNLQGHDNLDPEKFDGGFSTGLSILSNFGIFRS